MRQVLYAKYMARCMGCMSCMLACSRRLRNSFSVAKSAIRIKTKGGFSSGQMTTQHCLGCEDPPCINFCPTGALSKRGKGGIKLNASLCNGCKECLKGCPVEAIFFDEDKKLPIFCIHCGNCVNFCPHGCLSIEELP